MNRLAENLASVKARIANARQNNAQQNTEKSILLLAVSKTRDASMVKQAYNLGQHDFGENYLQEALDKIEALKELDICWHFIGPIQSNKTRPIAENFDWVQSIDREKIAMRLNEQRPSNMAPLNVCIQINIDNETSKSGTDISGAFALAKTVSTLPNLLLRGVMYIPAPQKDYASQLENCQRAFQEFTDLQQRFPTMDTLSLGMSSDLEAAIHAGSTMVRIGTDIFGPRLPKA